MSNVSGYASIYVETEVEESCADLLEKILDNNTIQDVLRELDNNYDGWTDIRDYARDSIEEEILDSIADGNYADYYYSDDGERPSSGSDAAKDLSTLADSDLVAELELRGYEVI